ncbi:unnamed protein product [Acidithrix sp. C25]|nr:unnamed protein product [Acidithrix sp. C25]
MHLGENTYGGMKTTDAKSLKGLKAENYKTKDHCCRSDLG